MPFGKICVSVLLLSVMLGANAYGDGNLTIPRRRVPLNPEVVKQGVRHDISTPFGTTETWYFFQYIPTNSRRGFLLEDENQTPLNGSDWEVCAGRVAWNPASGTAIYDPAGQGAPTSGLFAWASNAYGVVLYEAPDSVSLQGDSPQNVARSCSPGVNAGSAMGFTTIRFPNSNWGHFLTVNDCAPTASNLNDNGCYNDNTGTVDIWVHVID